MEYGNVKMTNNKTYHVRTDFDEIKTNEDAYFIGYLLGDGNYENGKSDNKSSSMSVTSKDKYIIEYFQKVYSPNSKIRSKIPVNNARPDIVSTEESHRIGFSSYYSNTFDKYGVLALKPNREIKNIPTKFMKQFILGFLDADGSISYHIESKNDKTRLRTTVKFAHPSLNMLNYLKNFLNSELGIGGSINLKKGENCYCYTIAGNIDCVLFINWVYSDKPEIYNIRKFNKGIDLINEFNSFKFRLKNNVVGVKITKYNTYSPFIVLNGKVNYLGTEVKYDDAVTKRIINEAINLSILNKNGWTHYNPTTNTLQLTYLSHDDNKQTFIEVSLNGEILKFQKLT